MVSSHSCGCTLAPRCLPHQPLRPLSLAVTQQTACYRSTQGTIDGMTHVHTVHRENRPGVTAIGDVAHASPDAFKVVLPSDRPTHHLTRSR